MPVPAVSNGFRRSPRTIEASCAQHALGTGRVSRWPWLFMKKALTTVAFVDGDRSFYENRR